MSFKAGHVGWFALDNIAGTLTNIQSYIDNVSVPQNVDMLDVSVLGTAAKGFIPGLTDGDQISISGPYDVAIHTHLTALKAGQAAGSSTASYRWGPGGSVAAQASVLGECWLASYQLSTSVSGRAEYSATLQVSGSVTNGTF